MSTIGERLVDGSREPNARSIVACVGSANNKRWKHLVQFIETRYPGIFSPEWLFGGQKYGWGLRFKKSKSFCTLIPERNRFLIQIVLGGKERDEVETILNELSPYIRRLYEQATTYHDGKWLAIPVDRDDLLEDIQRLLAIKRKPRVANLGARGRGNRPPS